MPSLDLSFLKTSSQDDPSTQAANEEFDNCPTLENRYGLGHNENHPSQLQDMAWDSTYKLEKFVT